jgi:hypothetical protein
MGNACAEDEDSDEHISNLGSKLADIQRRLVKHASIEAAYQDEINRAMANIPAAHVILKALPHSIIPPEHRALINAITGAISLLEYDTTRELVMHIHPRDAWTRPSPDEEGYRTKPDDLPPFPQP